MKAEEQILLALQCIFLSFLPFLHFLTDISPMLPSFLSLSTAFACSVPGLVWPLVICLSTLSCHTHHPNCFNAKDIRHKPRNHPDGLHSTDLVHICVIPALVMPLILFYFFHFSFISMVLDLLTSYPLPLYLVSSDLLHFVTQMTFCCISDFLSHPFGIPVSFTYFFISSPYGC